MYTGNANVVLFADDTTITTKGEDIGKVLSCGRETRLRASDWFNNNSLKVNKKKMRRDVVHPEGLSKRNQLPGPKS